MTGKTHIIGGFTAATASLYAAAVAGVCPEESYSIISCGVYILSSCVAAPVPDIDEKNSMIGRRSLIISTLFAMVQLFFKLLIFFSFGKTKRKLKEKARAIMHRGFTHYLFTWIVLSVFILVCGAILYCTYGRSVILTIVFGMSTGYLSHLLLDLISGKIQLLAPFSKKYIGCRIFPYKSIREVWLARPILLIAGIYFAYGLIGRGLW